MVNTLKLNTNMSIFETISPMRMLSPDPSAKTEIIAKIRMAFNFHHIRYARNFYVVRELLNPIILRYPFIRKHQEHINIPSRTFYGYDIDKEILEIGTVESCYSAVEFSYVSQFQKNLEIEMVI